MSLQLQGKVIAIIGGTTGLGFWAARACVGAGASVVVGERNEDSVAAAGGELDTLAPGRSRGMAVGR